MTVQDLINGSLRLLGVLASGETATASESNDALVSLNNMIDLWSVQKLLNYSSVEETFSLVANQQTYQMGSGAPDFNSTRPSKVENLVWQQPTSTFPFNLKIEIVTQDQWASLGVPTITSTIPTHCWIQYLYPYIKFNFWPVPSATNNVVIFSFKPFADFSALTSTLSLPPGYQKTLSYNLAVELGPEYAKSPTDLVIVQAEESKAWLKRINNSQNALVADAALLNRKPSWNWMTGD